MELENKDRELILKKLNFHFNRGEAIFFKIKTEEKNDYRNGLIKEIFEDSFLIEEMLMGEMLITFEEVVHTSITKSKNWRVNRS